MIKALFSRPGRHYKFIFSETCGITNIFDILRIMKTCFIIYFFRFIARGI